MSIADQLFPVQKQAEPEVAPEVSVADSLFSAKPQQIEQPPFPGLDKPMPIPGVEERAEPTLRSEFQEFHKMNNEFLMEMANKHFATAIDLMSYEKTFARTLKIGQGIRETGQGFVQLTSTGLEMMGLVDEGTTAQYTQMTIDQRRKFEEDFIKEFGEVAYADLAKMVGNFIPMALAPGGTTMVKATAIGATMSGGQFVEETDPDKLLKAQWENAKEGAMFGLAASTINILPKVKNWYRKKLLAQSKFAQEGMELSKRTGVDLKLSQITGDSATEWLENLARSSIKGEDLARKVETKQIIQSYKQWKRITNQLYPKEKVLARAANPNAHRFGFQAQSAFKRVMGNVDEGTGLLGQRAKHARENFAFIDKVTGKQPVIKLDNFRKALTKTIAENSKRGSGSQELRLAKEMQKLLDDFPEGSLATGEEMQGLLKKFGRASKGKKSIFKDIEVRDQLRPSNDAFKALSKDLDEAVNSSTGDIAQALKKARNQYAADTAQIKALEDTSIGALFGSTKRPSLAQIESTFHKMDPTELKTTMNILGDAAPDLHRMLQRSWVEMWMMKSTKAAHKDAFPFIAGKMTELKTDPAFQAVFNSAESRKIVSEGIEVARRIVMFNRTTGGRSVSRLKEVARVMASRDPTFLSGLAAEVFTPRILAKSLTDRRGIEALKAFAEPFNANQVTAAFITLNELSKEQE